MKDRILSWLTNVVGCSLLLGVGAGAVFTYNNYQFRKESDQNILNAQRDNIRAYCEQVWEIEHPVVEEEKEDANGETESK